MNQRRKVKRERVGLYYPEAAARCGFELFDGGDGARIDLDRDDALASTGEKRPREAARAGPDLGDVGAGEISGDPDDPGRDVSIEKEVLAETVAGIKAVTSDNVAKRREGVRQRDWPLPLSPPRKARAITHFVPPPVAGGGRGRGANATSAKRQHSAGRVHREYRYGPCDGGPAATGARATPRGFLGSARRFPCGPSAQGSARRANRRS